MGWARLKILQNVRGVGAYHLVKLLHQIYNWNIVDRDVKQKKKAQILILLESLAPIPRWHFFKR